MITEEQIAERLIDEYVAVRLIAAAQSDLAVELYREGATDLLTYARDRLIPRYLRGAAIHVRARLTVAIPLDEEPVIDLKKLRRAAEERAKALMPRLFREAT